MITVFARRRLPVVAGLAAFLVLVGSGSAWSYWTTQASAAGSVTTDTVAVSHAGFASPAETKYLPSSLTSTRSFTVTNNSTIAGTATVTIATSETGAASLPITVWRYTSGTCTDSTSVPGSGATTGTWGTTTMQLTLGIESDTKLAKLCVRTNIPDWNTLTTLSGGRTVNPQLSVSLNAQGWVATAPTATNKQRTAGMYPLAGTFFNPALSSWFTIRSKSTGYCLDVAGSGGANTRVISWTCHQEPNQVWQFRPVNGAVQNLVTIQPAHARSTRLTFAPVTTEGVQRIAAENTSSTTQQWYVQNSGTFYQLVSAETGMCLRMNTAGDVDVKVVECDDVQAQLTFHSVVTMSTSGSNVTLGFAAAATTGMTLQKKSNNGNWSDVKAIGTGSTSVAFSRNEISNQNNTEFRIVVTSTSQVVYDGIVLTRSWNTASSVAGAVQQ